MALIEPQAVSVSEVNHLKSHSRLVHQSLWTYEGYVAAQAKPGSSMAKRGMYWGCVVHTWEFLDSVGDRSTSLVVMGL